jgi:LuxR family transcriptional regulator, maltose regulon positive regulatory protein
MPATTQLAISAPSVSASSPRTHDGPRARRVWVVAFLLEATARDALGDPDAAARALDLDGHVLDLDGRVLDLDAAGRVLDLAEPGPALLPFPGQPAHHHEALTHGEARVLHYLPTNLSAREIADELYVSVNTVKTHQRHLYQKLGARNRTQAVDQARALGLLAAPFRGRYQ